MIRLVRASSPFCLFSFALLTVCLAGCGGGGGGRPAPTTKQATVSGSVVNNGTPIKTDSSVVFFCTEAGATLAGKIDALGKFNLGAADPAIGIPVGRYQVMVRPPEPKSVQTTSADYAKMMQGGSNPTAAAATPSDIPQPFLALDTTPLILEVKEGPNTFDIDLAKIGN